VEKMVKQGLSGLTTLISGNWNNGTNTGTFNWNLNNATSNVNRNIGTHLPDLVFGILRCLDKPCLLAKHSNIKPCIGRGGNAFEDSGILQRSEWGLL
jgi:hypothetical protein